VLGAGGVKLLALEARADAANEARTAAGLYHTAFLMPTRKDLARWLVNAAIHKVPLSGFADHRVSESVYLDDPEGNGIEVYADRDPSLWQWSDGTVTMATDQLDVDNLVSLTNTQVSDYAKAPDGLRIGHMHLRVGDLAKANGFYRETLGFDPTRARGGAAFLSSGRYHHHLAVNVWQSAGAGRRDEAATGLAWFSLEIDKPDLFAAKEERLRQAGVQVGAVADGLEAADPWGTRVRLVKV
jgi:catechol 2,3-dioxygenase